MLNNYRVRVVLLHRHTKKRTYKTSEHNITVTHNVSWRGMVKAVDLNEAMQKGISDATQELQLSELVGAEVWLAPLA